MYPELHRDVRLVVIGGCRNDDDRALLEQLKAVAHVPDGLPTSSGSSSSSGGGSGADGCVNNIEFIANAPFPVMLEHMSRASVGLHTMWNEHFGISVVEMMAAGLIVIAHDSGGPQMDIVTPAVVLRSSEERERAQRNICNGTEGSLGQAGEWLPVLT
jgi:alpha-1,2-mannosyltransferase